ncbi:MAG: hypothetical protein R2932_19060 [Caldilineaceae bacterium]
MLNAFHRGIESLSREKKIVFVLDTAERLLYSPFDATDGSTETAEVWQWLLESLPKWKNVVVIVAGRPEIQPIVDSIPETISSTTILLTPFPIEDSLRYFDSVVQMMRDNGQDGSARIVEKLTPALRRQTHDEAEGIPILLSLVIDLLLYQGTRPSASANEIMKRIMESGRMGQTVCALARAPKGVTPELLGKLLDCSASEAYDRLEEVSILSFVKIRPNDKRVFLHDVMYELFEEHVFDEMDLPSHITALELIEDYYQEELQQVREELGKLFQPIMERRSSTLDSTRLEKLSMQRRILLTEYLHYLLTSDPVRGFQHYYRYAREAIYAGDTLLDRELHLVVLEFWRKRDPEGKLIHIEGLERRHVYGVSRMRRVTQAYGEERYSDAIKIAGAIRQQIDTQPSERVRTTRSVLATWEAYARAMRGESGDAHEARILLSAAIDDMTAYLNELDTPDASPMLAFQDQLGDYYESATEFRRWRATAVLALAYRVRGYMRRTQNRLQEAVEDYQRAANLWQDVNVLVEDATTRNDLGRALVIKIAGMMPAT